MAESREKRNIEGEEKRKDEEEESMMERKFLLCDRKWEAWRE